MCSILAILDLKSDPAALRRQAIRLSKLQRHRGPDWSGVYADAHAVLAHERLAIVDVTHGAQPLLNASGTHALAVNGEIYNHRELRSALREPYPFQTDSDCEIILALYRDYGVEFLDMLNGIFAFVLYDAERRRYLIARDHIGIVPLYTGEDAAGNVYVASEMKALVPVCTSIQEFPPGHFLDSEIGVPRRYYERTWRAYDVVAENHDGPAQIRDALTRAVERQLMCDVPYGVLLSGGLDSSIIAAVAKKFAARRIEEAGRTPAWWPQLHSFSIGLEGSPDLTAARAAAQHIGSVHHEFHFTVQEGL
ncbi:MAG: asparagine synthase (glutamine-hydrolyzing), partial [Gemmatimonadota bacterium]